MSSEQNTVGQDGVVENVAVVCDVSVGHQEVSVADSSDSVFFIGTAINCDTFTEQIVITDFNSCWSSCVAEVLRFGTDDCAWKEAIAFADRGVSRNRDVVVEDAAVADRDMGADDAKGAHHDLIAQLCLWVNVSEGRNVIGHGLGILTYRWKFVFRSYALSCGRYRFMNGVP